MNGKKTLFKNKDGKIVLRVKLRSSNWDKTERKGREGGRKSRGR
jgi:hypothetical protein